VVVDLCRVTVMLVWRETGSSSACEQAQSPKAALMYVMYFFLSVHIKTDFLLLHSPQIRTKVEETCTPKAVSRKDLIHRSIVNQFSSFSSGSGGQ
jgi:hypothetical protein